MTTLTIKPAVTFTAIRSALRNILQTTDNTFLSKLFAKEFTVEVVSEKEVNIVTKSGQVYVALVAGKKVVILKNQASKNSVNVVLGKVTMKDFIVNENAFVIDLESNTVKSATVSTGWIPEDGTSNILTLGATMALSNLSLVSTKGSSGKIEHFIFDSNIGTSASGTVELREALTSIVEANGGFVVVEQAPKASNKLSGAEKETSKRTSGKAMKVHAAILEENRKAQKKAGKDAELAQEILTRRNAESLQYA